MSTRTVEYFKAGNDSSAAITISTRVLSGLDFAVTCFQDLVSQSTWGPLSSFAKNTIISCLKKIQRGQLIIRSLGEVYRFGEASAEASLRADIHVLDEGFWLRLFLNSEFGFADAFMLQYIEIDSADLVTVFKIFLLNRKELFEMQTFASPVIRGLSYVANSRLANGIFNSSNNISTHYDMSNEAFASFLSRDMTYTCAVFDETLKGCDGDLKESRPIAPPRSCVHHSSDNPPDDLEKGQLRKLHMIAQRARLKKGSRVLEIGCGWGSFAILAAGTYGASVEAITLSAEQIALAEDDVHAAGLSELVTFHLMDYRDLPASFCHAFDAVVAVGVMEHVGSQYIAGWFEKVSWALKEQNATMVFTGTTVPDTRWIDYKRNVDFIQRYIFPGGELSTVKNLVNAIIPAKLNVNSIENLAPHYARTLREWSHRFQHNFASHIAPALKSKYASLSSDDLEIFRRKWIYYFAYCEAGFSMGYLAEHLFVLTREDMTMLP